MFSESHFGSVLARVLTGAVMIAAASGAASAKGVTVNVSLWDRGGNLETMLDHMGQTQGGQFGMNGGMMGMGMGMRGQGPMGPMGIALDRESVPAGEVSFAVTNDSRGMEHEMVVARIDEANPRLPYDRNKMKLEEDTMGALGEVEELRAGTSGDLTLTLEPGKYLLFCNLPGHYALGMWTVLSVSG